MNNEKLKEVTEKDLHRIAKEMIVEMKQFIGMSKRGENLVASILRIGLMKYGMKIMSAISAPEEKEK